jgi:putative oxidoreductase
LRRLFSTFAPGWPGVGLLLMRVAAGVAMISTAIMRLQTGALAIPVLAIVAGLLLMAGLWTPVAGSVVAIIGIWRSVNHISDPWAGMLLASMGAALALVGPGAWSVDARLFGWKRIDFRDRKG